MEINDYFSALDISQFLERIRVEDFENVNKFYLTSKVDTQSAARKLMFETTKQMLNWENLKPSDDKKELENYLNHQEMRAKIVQDYYEENKDDFQDIEKIEGQKRLIGRTGVVGGSFLLEFNKKIVGSTETRENRERLAECFLKLAKAINDGTFDLPSVVAVSFVKYPMGNCRIKVEADHPSWNLTLKQIHSVIGPDFVRDMFFKVKSSVASYLTWGAQKPEDIRKFEFENYIPNLNQQGEFFFLPFRRNK